MKNTKLNALSTATALFATIATVNALPATAEAASPGKSVTAPEVSPDILNAMRRDLKGTEEELLRRLDFEAKAPSLERGLREQLGDRFGGAWLNEEGTGLIVGVTAGSALAGSAVDEWGAETAFAVPALGAALAGVFGVVAWLVLRRAPVPAEAPAVRAAG